jgi:hypothetical protein
MQFGEYFHFSKQAVLDPSKAALFYKDRLLK